MTAMSARLRERLVVLASLIVAVVVANVLGDVFRLPSFVGLRGGAIAVVVVASLGASGGFAMARVRDTNAARPAVAGAIVAALVAFLALRFQSPWVDLGPFGAGPLTALALVVLPLAQLASIFMVTRWTVR